MGQSTENLVLVRLAAGSAAGSEPGSSCSLSELTNALSLSRSSLSDQIELVSTLESIEDQGLVTVQKGELEPGSDDRVRFSLTEAGRNRVAPIKEELAATRIEVVTDSRETLTIEETASRFGLGMVEVASTLTDDGIYYPADSPIDEFIGREEPLERCSELLQAVQAGDGQLICLVGPAGVGKTTLAEHLLQHATESGLKILRGHCRGEGTAPYQPIRDALSDVDGESLFSDLRRDVDNASAYRTQQTALLTAITDRLAGDEGRYVLCLDDVHLADAGTVAFFDYLLDREMDVPFGILCSYRPQEVPENSCLPTEPDPADSSLHYLDIQPFDREHTRALVERVLDRHDVPGSFVDVIFERTGGNPLFVEETVTALLEAGELNPELDWYPDHAHELDIPGKVREIIEQRVERFPAQAQDLLTWSAILGVQFPEETLEWVSDLSPTQLQTYIDLFVNGAVLERTERGVVQFRSGVMRKALVEHIPSHERQNRHAVVAEALVDNHEGDDVDAQQAGMIAYHHDCAGNTREAIEWYRRAARCATDVYGHEVAIEHYKKALSLAKRTDDGETILAIIEALAGIYVTTGAYDEAERHVAYARERANETSSRQRLLHLASRIATERGAYESAIKLANEGLALEDATTRACCRLLQQRGLAELEQGMYDQARETVTRQRKVAAELGDAQLEGNAVVALGAAARGQSKHDEARSHIDQARKILEVEGDRRGVAETHAELGEIAREQSDYGDAADHFLLAQDLFSDVGDRHAVGKVLLYQGEMWWERSDYDEASENYRQAQAVFREVGDRHGVGQTLNNLGLLAREQSDYETAQEYYQQALEILRDVGALDAIGNVLSNLGSLAWRRGKYEEARQYYQQAIEIDRSQDNRYGLGIRHNNIGTVAREQGAYDEAETYLERGLELFQEVGDRHAVGKATQNLGYLSYLKEDYEEAREYLQRALEIFHGLDHRHDIARASSILGAVATKQGGFDEAREQFEQALDGFRDVDDRHELGKCLVRFAGLEQATGDLNTARQRGERALSMLQDIGTAEDTLDAFEVVVECAQEAGDYEQALSWCREALALIGNQDQTDGTANHERRQWFEAQRQQLEEINQ